MVGADESPRSPSTADGPDATRERTPASGALVGTRVGFAADTRTALVLFDEDPTRSRCRAESRRSGRPTAPTVLRLSVNPMGATGIACIKSGSVQISWHDVS